MSAPNRPPDPAHAALRCSFCGKRRDQVKGMIGGSDPRIVAICDECVALCTEILSESGAPEAP